MSGVNVGVFIKIYLGGERNGQAVQSYSVYFLKLALNLLFLFLCLLFCNIYSKHFESWFSNKNLHPWILLNWKFAQENDKKVESLYPEKF